MFSLKTSMLKNLDVFQTSPNTNFPQISYILITSCIQEFRDYVQSTLLYGLRCSLICCWWSCLLLFITALGATEANPLP